jgi:hypothetical protein
METRRIRRQERRRVYRTGLLAFSVAVLGVALGMALPDNRIAFFALLGVAACCVVIVIARDERRAPLHGLHHVVRLPLRTSVTTTFASIGSRIAGTVRSGFGTRPPSPIVLDEPDDEATAWWGPTAVATALPVPVPAESAVAVPPLAVLAPAEAPEPTYAAIALVQPEPTTPVPVLAAPIATAHVPADPSVTVKVRVSLKVAAARRHLQPLARKVKLKRAHEETQVSAST